MPTANTKSPRNPLHPPGTVGACVTCGLVAFDANEPPHVFVCRDCRDRRFELVQLGEGAGGLRSVASGDAGALSGCLPNGSRA